MMCRSRASVRRFDRSNRVASVRVESSVVSSRRRDECASRCVSGQPKPRTNHPIDPSHDDARSNGARERQRRARTATRVVHPHVIMSARKRYAVVCAANFNRSMEAHKVFADAGLDVASFGAAPRVKLPGASRDDPNVYPFDDISYEDIASDLERQPSETVANYEERGMFDMLRRNAKIKPRPNRWQTHSDEETFDVVVCFEERVFDLVVGDLREKGKSARAALVVNLDVRDSHGESVAAAPKALRLCEALEASEDWECDVDDIMEAFEAAEGMRPLYTVCFY